MRYDVTLHNLIQRHNPLQDLTEHVTSYFTDHPQMYKAALIVNHIFRAVAMAAFTLFLPFSPFVNIAICFAGSLFYRLTVETNCAYKFALPAFAGSVAFSSALTALTGLVSGVAFVSLGAFASAAICLIPLAGYITYIALTVNYDVDHR